MKALSEEMRERIMRRWDSGKWTQEEVAKHYEVSLGMVRKLSAQRGKLGHIEALWCNCGRPPKIGEAESKGLLEAVGRKPDATLAELAAGMEVECTPQAVFYALRRAGVSYKKKRSAPANATGRTSPGSARGGGRCRGGSTRPSSSSSTRRASRRT